MKELIKKITGIALAFGMLLGSAQVMADAPGDTSLNTIVWSAQEISVDNTVNVELAAGQTGKWYKLHVSAAHRILRAVVSDPDADTVPHLMLYDAQGNEIMDSAADRDCPELVINNIQDKDTDFYIWASRTSASASAGAYKLTVKNDAYMMVACQDPFKYTGAAADTLTEDVDKWTSVEVRIDMYDNPMSVVEYSYQWYTVDPDGTETVKAGATENTLTAASSEADHYRVKVEDGYMTRVFDFYLNWENGFHFSEYNRYYLVESGRDVTIEAPSLLNNNYYQDPVRYILHNYTDTLLYSDTTTFTISAPEHFDSYPVQASRSFSDAYCTLGILVKDAERICALVLDRDETIQYSTEGLIGHFDKIYEYTPAVSGTYTFGISGDLPANYNEIIFDGEGNQIALGGSHIALRNSAQGIIVDSPRSTLTLHLDKGSTYYFVATGGADLGQGNNGSFTVRLTLDAADPEPETPVTPFEPEQPANTGTPSADTPVTQNTAAPANTSATTPTPAIPSADNSSSSSEGGVAGFVERLYTIALGRASDPVGKQDWIDAITLRGETGAGCARGFLYSPEFLNKGVSNEEFVATLYRTFFDREPDQAGFNAWVEVLNNGTSKEEVIEGFINSTEWANLCLFYGIRNGGTGVPNIEIEPNQATIDFATRLYTTCLGRNADQNGLMAWARQLANQRDTGTGAARGFFFSSEFTGQNVSNGEYVTRLYRTFMNREPDQAGYDAWVGQLDAGVSREEVFEGFAQSIEFARICAQYGIVR